MHANTFFREVQRRSLLKSLEEAENVTAIVFQALSGRLTPDEARHVESQLPKGLKRLWMSNMSGFMPSQLEYKKPEDLYHMIQIRLNREGIGLDAEKAALAVFHTLKEQITEGEINDIEAQLPQAIKPLWQTA